MPNVRRGLAALGPALIVALIVALPGVLTALAPALAAQTFATSDPVLRRIWTLGMDSSRVYGLAQPLLDSIGPRLTGTPQQKAGNDWLVKTYRSFGIDARNESYGTWRGWSRGVTHVDLVAPRLRTLEGTMLAWSPGTKGAVTAPAVVLPDFADAAAFTRWLPDAKGKYVLISMAQPTCRPDTTWASWATPDAYARMRADRARETTAWMQRVLRTAGPSDSSYALALRTLPGKLEKAGASGIVTNLWSQGWGVDKIFNARTTTIPTLDLSCEDYGLVFRLADHGQGPVLRVDAQSQALGEIPVYNTIAEIRGSEKPDEYVMLSAHFDSWDGGSGATDNGTGTITMLEAMRILKQVYPHPKRTILVGHWSGEEQGLVGSRAFAADHPEIVKGLQALFNQDNGTGRIVNISASGLVGASSVYAGWLARIPTEISRQVQHQLPRHAGRRGKRQRVVRLLRRARVRARLDELRLRCLHLAHQPRHLRQDRLGRPEVERDARGDARLPGERGPADRPARPADHAAAA